MIKQVVIEGEIAFAVNFSILADMHSGPFVLDTSSDLLFHAQVVRWANVITIKCCSIDWL